MNKNINFIIVNVNAYGAYETRDMAGSMRVKNIFDPLLNRPDISISNLILLDLLSLQNNNNDQSNNVAIDCLSIGYTSFKSPSSIISYLKKGYRFIKAHHKKDAENIIYNYQHPDIRNFLFLLYAKMKGFKIVFDFVEDKQHESVETFNDKARQKLSLFFLKLIPFYADAVFVISNHLLLEANKLTRNKIPVYILPISVDFKNIDIYKKETTNSVAQIFYGGSFAQKDGLQYLLAAMDILKERKYQFKLILTGKGRPEDIEKLFPKFKDNDLIDYRGFLSTEQYFKLLSNVDICCMTRNNSAFANAGFPFKLGEFLAAGKLIIASKIGDVEKYLTHKENAFLVAPESTEEIVEGLAYFLNDLKDLSNSMGSKARLVAQNNFDANISSHFMLEKCRNLLN